ncbi:MAG: hypothetical protein HS114_34690 [Anaerolineales bacterium]|nr:hypothetical protein [Anaerolineales bacterium]
MAQQNQRFVCPKCRRWRNSRGRPFKSQAAVDQHAQTCADVPPLSDPVSEDFDLEMTQLLAEDESDGVFWGLAWELGEW